MYEELQFQSTVDLREKRGREKETRQDGLIDADSDRRKKREITVSER